MNTHTHLGFLSFKARPSPARKSATLTNTPVLLEQNRVTGTGSPVTSWATRGGVGETRRYVGVKLMSTGVGRRGKTLMVRTAEAPVR